ncbi:MAG: hypothetical protein GWP08_02555 [Nitrospiraceae bacterium]|nr:hypothetical protein [Nitrospiraceae bacterium]
MDLAQRDAFTKRWGDYVPGADLPIAFYYTDDPAGVDVMKAGDKHRCFLAQLSAVRRGRALCFEESSLTCSGAKRYLGFSQKSMPNFDHFLSCGIPGRLEGERYKKSPELVREIMANAPLFVAPARYIVFKRWDAIEAGDEPEAVFFEAKPDVLSALFTLAGYDEAASDAVIAPFGAGCSSIVLHPYLEQGNRRPRAVLGMFDVSARPWVNRETLSFAVPISKFARMIDNMDESFLITPSWERVRNRL